MRTNPRAEPLRLFAWVAVMGVSGCELAYPLGGYQALELDGASNVDAGGVAVIQQTTGQASDTRELVVTPPANAAKGSALVLLTVSSETQPTSVSSAGLSWTVLSRSSTHVAATIWVAFVPVSGSFSVKVTWPASPALSQATALVHLSEWAGLASLGSEVHTFGTGGGPISTGSLVANDRTALLLAAAGGHVPFGPPTNGFTTLTAFGLNDYHLELAYLVAPTSGPHSTSWTHDSTRGWEALLVSLNR